MSQTKKRGLVKGSATALQAGKKAAATRKQNRLLADFNE